MKASRSYLAVTAVAAIVMCVWSVRSVGADGLVDQLATVGSLLPLVLVFAGVRFAFQAAGWRLAMPEDVRPPWCEAFQAVVAGEGAGYFAFGPVSREPVKAALVSHRMPQRVALASAVAERFAYTMSAAVLSVAGVAVLAVRAGASHALVASGALVAAVVIAFVARRITRGGAIVALASLQEVVNLGEAYIVLVWLGATPTFATVVALEGGSRVVNAAGQFIPGKLGVSEAASTMLAAGLQLGSGHGLMLALARRVRSMLWGAAGMTFLTYRAAQSLDVHHDKVAYQQ
jgi:hypothetical protein